MRLWSLKEASFQSLYFPTIQEEYPRPRLVFFAIYCGSSNLTPLESLFVGAYSVGRSPPMLDRGILFESHVSGVLDADIICSTRSTTFAVKDTPSKELKIR